ncbi:hypothetical protein D3C85_965270 [compost metagenome]
MRAVAGRGERIRRHVVDLVLAFLHARHVVGERHRLRLIARIRRRETHQLGDTFQVGRILARAFLQHLAELRPERGVVFRLVFRHVFEQRQDALGRPFTDGAHIAAFLQDLARHVQRQVRRIDHPTHEAQVRRQQLVRIVHDENALHIQLHAMAAVAVPHIHGRMLGHVQQLRVFAAAFHAVVRPGQRIVVVVRHRLVELAVLLFRHVRLAAGPQRIRLVHRFKFVGLDLLALLLVPLFLGHADRQGNMVRIAAQDLAQLPAIQQLVLVGAQVQRHIRATARLFSGGNRELALAVRFPLDRVRRASAAAHHRDLVRHDERRIETHAELADELRILLLVARQLREKLPRTRTGNRAQVGHGLVARQTDPVVRNRDRAGGLVVADRDRQFAIAFQQLRLVDGLEAQLVAGIRRVRHQLAQENFLVAVQRMDHQVQQLLHLGLEPQGFGRGSRGGLAHSSTWL